MTRGRLEAFSDGVLAVAITLLVLDLHVDAGPGHASLAHQLGRLWPQLAAYVVSFLVIGVIWVNHHALCALISRVDRQLMFLNLILLLFVTTVPFTTAVLADFFTDGGTDARLAVLCYGLSSIGMALAFTAMLRHIITHDLLYRPVDEATGRLAVRRFGLGSLLYPIVTLLGLLWPPLALVGMGALALYYVAERTTIVPGEGDDAVEGAADTDSGADDVIRPGS